MNKLGKVIKLLPNKMEKLTLDLSDNILGNVYECMQTLGEVLRQIPSYNLVQLRLDLSWNDLVENDLDLGKTLKYLPRNLQRFELDLGCNSLGGGYTEHMMNLGKSMR